MKILIIIHNQTSTGPFIKVFEECEILSRMGHDVTLLCTSPKARFFFKKKMLNKVIIFESPDLLWGKLRQGIDVWNIVNRLIFIANNNFDIVHGIDCRPVVIFPALFLKFFKKTKFVLNWWDLFGHGATALERSGKFYANTAGKIETFFEEYFRKYADFSIVISSYLMHKLIKLGYPRGKIKLLRLGCDTVLYGPLNKIECRKKLGLCEDLIILCYVGTIFDADKKLLLETLKLLKDYSNKKIITLMVGNHKIEDKICTDLNIKLTGKKNLKDLYVYLGAADLCLLPMKVNLANIARWPSKAADYLNAGRPIVTTKVSDFEELFDNYDLGYIAPEDNAFSLCKTIQFALNDKERWGKIGENCRQFAMEYLDTKKIMIIINNIYKQLLTTKRNIT